MYVKGYVSSRFYSDACAPRTAASIKQQIDELSASIATAPKKEIILAEIAVLQLTLKHMKEEEALAA